MCDKSYMLTYYDNCECETRTYQYNTREELHSAVYDVLNNDLTNGIEIYECKKLIWDVVIKEKETK